MASTISTCKILKFFPVYPYRDGTGKRAVHLLRSRLNRVPAKLYGYDKRIYPDVLGSVGFQDAELELRSRGGSFENTLYRLKFVDEEGEPTGPEQVVIPRDLQLHVIDQRVISCNFLRYDPEKGANVFMPFKLTNDEIAPGVKKGGFINHINHGAWCRVTGEVIPPFIEVNCAHLQPGKMIKWSQLDVPKNLQLLRNKYGPQERDVKICNINKKGLGITKEDEEKDAA